MIFMRIVILDKWHKVWFLCSRFYQIKYCIDNQVNNIYAAITNSKKDINLDIININ